MKFILYLLLSIGTTTGELHWSDFKGIPDRKEVLIGKVAHTTTEWEIQDSVINGKMYLNLTMRFVPESSWSITNSEAILRHENVHYRISQLWLSKCIQKLAKYNGSSEKNRTRAYNIYNHCWREEERLQNLFDKETGNSTRPHMERVWETQILKIKAP